MNENDKIKTNSLEAWVLAARPKTLSGAAVPVMIAAALALKTTGWQEFRLLPAILCFLFAFLMQIDSNLINDYFDFVHGNDDPATRLGPKRACAEGWITPGAMRCGLAVVSAAACAVGLPLVYYGGWEMVIVGAVCVLFAFLYTTFFSYRGLGDILVLLFFGIVPVCFTYYVIVPEHLKAIPWSVFLISVGCGLVIDTLLCINNFRDRHNDEKDGKRTLIVRLGEKRGAQLYNAAGSMGAALTMVVLLFTSRHSQIGIVCMFPFLVYVYKHSQSYIQLKETWEGKGLNKVLGMTARDMFIYGLMTVVAIYLSTL
jgi:1,4-dihydroxy-2-naphthoate octaprenyltransferase